MGILEEFQYSRPVFIISAHLHHNQQGNYSLVKPGSGFKKIRQNMFRKVLRKSRELKKTLGRFFGIQKCEPVNPIIVYQMGKVGSETVQLSLMAALKKNNIDVPVHHIHNLYCLDEVERTVRTTAGRHNAVNTLIGIKQGKKLLKEIIKYPEQRWNLISLVREPIAQNVADFCHNMHEFFPNWRRDFSDGNLTIEKLHEYFLGKYSHVVTKIWFEQQMEPVWGINVYATPFPREVGYKIYHGPRADLLLMRLEDLDNIGVNAMEVFLGINGVDIIRQNVAEEKDYRDVYLQFRKRPLPANFIDEMYNSRFMNHFYTQDECDTFRRYWSKE